MARPMEYNEATGDDICEKLLEGKSLRQICRDEAMPSASTIFKWLANNETFAKQYAHAREAQADVMADEIVDIADGLKNGKDADVQRDRLAVDARKWVASKLKPKKYGDKLDLTSGGDKLSDDLDGVARATRLASIMADIEKRRNAN